MPDTPDAPRMTIDQQTAGVVEAATNLVNFAWSCVTTDGRESGLYLQSLIDNLRAALAAAPPPPDEARETLPEAVRRIQRERPRLAKALAAAPAAVAARVEGIAQPQPGDTP